MRQQSKSTPNNLSLPLGLVLFFVVAFMSSAPVVIEQMYRPERLLSHTNSWHIITKSTGKSAWNASDGFSAKYIDIKPTTIGLKVILQPTELATRETYFNEALVTTNTFKLSVEVNTPTACHNGLVFRGNEEGEYYLFLVSSESSYTVEILRRESNQDLPREAIIPNTTVSNSVGQPRTLAIIGKGQSYYFYINGIYVNQMSDSRLNGNRVGIEAFT
jgi:hypothetical protein